MGYQRSDYRSGRYDEGRDRERERNQYQRERGYDYRGGSDYDDDRGFFDRAGDEVRSWFGDDEAERRREEDRRRYEQESGDYRGSDYRGSEYRGERGGNWRGRFQDRDEQRRAGHYGGRAREDYLFGSDTREGSGFGSDRSQRFDRSETGNSGPNDGGWLTGGYSGPRSYGSTARTAALYQGTRGGRDQDPHYSEWRHRQIQSLDRDYDDYRREHQSKFEKEFGSWREKRQGQRQLLNQVTEHMEVIGSDGQHIGTVDKVRGDRIFLTRSDPSAGGHHHSIPCDWVDKVEDKVTISKSTEEARSAWRDEETNRALFERDDQGSEGPHVLGRSFSGTYRE